jgi:cyclopropane fatty-acyl-phospholipid synthase-like methyltransferase
MSGRIESDVVRRMGARYRVDAPITVELERAVLGSDYGANGYATLPQVNMLAAVLALHGGQRLLDIGAGCGWPGLYLAATTGCDVVSTDIPAEGMRRAHRRSQNEGLADRSVAVVASARYLPFRPESFDAIVHTDVLC